MHGQPLPLVDSDQPGPPAEPRVVVRVALVNMPFAAAHMPSIQCGVLKAELTRAGHEVDVFYLNLDLAAEVGAAVYTKIAALRTDQFLGEWLFSVAAFGARDDQEAYRAACPSIDETCASLGLQFEELCRLRDETMPALIERWASATDWSVYAAVGFTSTFEQNTASFALARAIKARYPQLPTIFGGANFDDEMGPEYLRAFDWIDYAVVGEGDEVLLHLVDRIAHGRSGVGLAGVVGRVGDTVVASGAAPQIRQMDALADPDYDEFFAALARLGRDRVLGDQPPMLIFESSRGCWWGQKHHCTFCGLNANGMAYRSKSPARVHAELRALADRYQIVNFFSVDNIIDMRYLDELCKPLAEEHYDYTFFYEVKANLTRAQLQTMARGGIVAIQPGIESLNTHILALMRKGTTMLRNVRLLKWAHYYGMRVSWNILTGFPGERREDYEAQARLVPLLRHLPPPAGGGRLWMERFSPYYKDPGFPAYDLRPQSGYRFVYPADQIDLEKIAYFFEYTMDDVIPDAEHANLYALVTAWRDSWQSAALRPLLAYQRAPDWLQIVDTRDPAEPRAFSFRGLEAAAYEACADTDHTPERVAAEVRAHHHGDVDAAAIGEMLRRFCDLGLMIEEDGHFLALAVPTNPNW